jgi:hypothetical protein
MEIGWLTMDELGPLYLDNSSLVDGGQVTLNERET